jgi:hypothetical protein
LIPSKGIGNFPYTVSDPMTWTERSAKVANIFGSPQQNILTGGRVSAAVNRRF